MHTHDRFDMSWQIHKNYINFQTILTMPISIRTKKDVFRFLNICVTLRDDGVWTCTSCAVINHMRLHLILFTNKKSIQHCTEKSIENPFFPSCRSVLFFVSLLNQFPDLLVLFLLLVWVIDLILVATNSFSSIWAFFALNFQ